MQIDELISKRFQELHDYAMKIPLRPAGMSDYFKIGDFSRRCQTVDPCAFAEWTTSVMSLFSRVFGEESLYYRNFNEKYSQLRNSEFGFKECIGIFRAAKADYESGCLSSIKLLVSAEVIDDALDQAAELLSVRYKDPVCVVAGVVLETALKRLCMQRNIPYAKLDRMNADLCVDVPDQSILAVGTTDLIVDVQTQPGVELNQTSRRG